MPWVSSDSAEKPPQIDYMVYRERIKFTDCVYIRKRYNMNQNLFQSACYASVALYNETTEKNQV